DGRLSRLGAEQGDFIAQLVRARSVRHPTQLAFNGAIKVLQLHVGQGLDRLRLIAGRLENLKALAWEAKRLCEPLAPRLEHRRTVLAPDLDRIDQAEPALGREKPAQHDD